MQYTIGVAYKHGLSNTLLHCHLLKFTAVSKAMLHVHVL